MRMQEPLASSTVLAMEASTALEVGDHYGTKKLTMDVRIVAINTPLPANVRIVRRHSERSVKTADSGDEADAW